MAQNRYILSDYLATVLDRSILSELASDDSRTLGNIDDSNPIIRTAIEQASAEVERNALTGRRYSLDRLTALQSDGDATLQSLVAWLAIGFLYDRRGGSAPDSVARRIMSSREQLSDLSKGAQVFKDNAAQRSGLPDFVVLTTVQRGNLNLPSDSRFYPPRRTERV